MTREKINQRLSLIVSLQVFLLGAKNCLIQGIPLLFAINDRLNFYILAVVCALYVYALLISSSIRIPKYSCLFCFFIILSYLATFLVFPQNIPYIEETWLRVFIIFFVTSILLMKLADFTYLDKYMTIFAYPTIIAGGVGGYFISLIGHVTTTEYEGNQYATSLSYAVLMGVMWLLHSFFKKGYRIPLLFAIGGIIVILLYGSRNPLLALAMYIAIELWDKAEYGSTHRGLYKFIVVFGVAIAFVHKTIIRFLAEISNMLGFSSRTLDMLSADTIDQTNRDTIHDSVYKLINDNPIFGTGIQGDLANLGEMAHGLYLNIWCTYGYIIGTLFMLYIGVNIVKSLKRAKGLDHQILVIYVCLVLPRGFTGGDMWQSDIFWWLMAIIFVILSKKYNHDNQIYSIQN